MSELTVVHKPKVVKHLLVIFFLSLQNVIFSSADFKPFFGLSFFFFFFFFFFR